MQSSTSTPSPTAFASFNLPTELIDKTLQQGGFTNEELSQSALISRQFLHSAQRIMYRHLELYWDSVENGLTPTTSPCIVRPISSTEMVLKTLESSPDIRQIVQSLSFHLSQSAIDRQPFVPTEKISSNVVIGVLMSTPNVNHIKFDTRFSASEHLAPSAVVKQHTITSLDLAFLQDKEIAIIRKMPNLRKLKTPGISIADDSALSRPLLSNLEVLDICSIPVPPSSVSQRLKILRISDVFEPIDFSLLPDLNYLILHCRSTLEHGLDLSGLTQLQTLRLEGRRSANGSSGVEIMFNQLLASSPPQKICLDFPSYVPNDPLVRHLRGTTPFVTDQIRLLREEEPRPLSSPE